MHKYNPSENPLQERKELNLTYNEVCSSRRWSQGLLDAQISNDPPSGGILIPSQGFQALRPLNKNTATLLSGRLVS